MTRSAHTSASPPRVLRERDALLGARSDREFATFCSISLTSEPRASKSAIEEAARLQQQYLQGDRELPSLLQRLRRSHKRGGGSSGPGGDNDGCCRTLRRSAQAFCAASGRRLGLIVRLRIHAALCIVLFIAGTSGVVWALLVIADADWYLFLGALVSLAFSTIVIVCYTKSRAVRGHPNSLILSKSCVDLLLALLYVFEYATTQFATPPISLPVRIAALTQALLVCGEFWFIAIPIDMVQSITNPFTSYAHNIRLYWLYSVLSGAICGFALWILDEGSSQDDSVGRFFWFHENTDRPGFWWHHWLSYHVWVLAYLVFATLSIIYVKRRLKRGLEETFDVRRRVLSSGLLTCWIYITWSLIVLALFVATNLSIVQQTVDQDVFEDLVNFSAFLHSARGGLNILVWLVINNGSLHAVCFRSAFSGKRKVPCGVGSTAVSSNSRSSSMAQPAFGAGIEEEEEEELLNKPELNTSLRKQMIQMATTGIIESVEHYHRSHRRVASNQTFRLDWQRSPHQSRQGDQFTTSITSSKVVASRNSTICVVESDGDSGGLSSFLPLRMREMQFYDFQPRVFASIRQMHGIHDHEYIQAFRYTMNERMSEGRSGAFVFTTSNRRYIVKSTTAAEKTVLLNLLPSYAHYLKWNPKSLLPKFLGFHAMKMYGQVFYFVVMANVLNTNEVIHRRYDIKGSWVDRNAPACILGEKYRCSKCNRFFLFGVSTGPGSTPCEPIGSEHYPDITLRDNDLKKRIKLESDTALQLVKQLTRDSDFLASMGIMDYSLLVGAHYSHFTIADNNNTKVDPSVPLTDSNEKIEHQRVASLPCVTRQSTYGSGGLQESNAESSRYMHDLCDEDTEDEAECSERGPSSGDRNLELVDNEEVLDSTINASGSVVNVRHQHRYRAHQVSGPSTYYFGLVDILQKWTLSKQVERAYKVHLLRKAPRGVSAINPRAYATRFQRKMNQLFMTTPSHLLHLSQSILDEGPQRTNLPDEDAEEHEVGGVDSTPV